MSNVQLAITFGYGMLSQERADAVTEVIHELPADDRRRRFFQSQRNDPELQ
jgi:hypothetical protein